MHRSHDGLPRGRPSFFRRPRAAVPSAAVYISATLLHPGADRCVTVRCSSALSPSSGCGQRLVSTPVSTRTSARPDDTFACVKKQLGELGYKQTSIDATGAPGHRHARSTTRSRRPDVQFRRMVEKLDVDVAAEADGQHEHPGAAPHLCRVHHPAGTHRGAGERIRRRSRPTRRPYWTGVAASSRRPPLLASTANPHRPRSGQ